MLILKKLSKKIAVNEHIMNDEKKRKFNRRMKALNEKYCQQLPAKYYEIENSWNTYLEDTSNPESIETFYRLIHTIKGTAATFGFVTQADICFEIQKILLDGNKEGPTLPQNLINKIQIQLGELQTNISAPAEDIS